MNTFRVLQITNKIDEYPDCKEDTLEFPDLVEEVEDEMEIFILCVETDEFWKSREFFSQVTMKTFNSEDFHSE